MLIFIQFFVSDSAQQAPASSKFTSKGNSIESSNLHPKYHRKPISSEEMEYIEVGCYAATIKILKYG